jgi:chromatin assembly factor 1 subunit B
MRALALELEWHEQQKGIFAVDIATDGTIATGGQDKRVSLWRLEPDWTQLSAVANARVASSKKQRYAAAQTAAQSCKFLDSLEGHAAAVSVVRFDPKNPQRLVSGADDGYAVLWKYDHTQGKWRLEATLHEHNDMIMDVAWGSDGKRLATASVDNTVAVWDTTDSSRPRLVLSLREHTNYVQGVAWDPLGAYLCSMGADRLLRIYEWSADRKRVLRSLSVSSISRSDQEPDEELKTNSLEDRTSKERVHASDETLPTKETELRRLPQQRLFESQGLLHFFRRLAWSPDGSFFVCPAGIVLEPSALRDDERDASAPKRRSKGAHVFARKDLTTPLLHLGGHKESILGVRFCPVRFTRRCQESSSETETWCSRLPYRLVFAIYSAHGLYLYDTETPHPIAAALGLHFGAVTDVAWSPDASFLLMASLDGFLSLVWFENPSELGTVYRDPDETANRTEQPVTQSEFHASSMVVSAVSRA